MMHITEFQIAQYLEGKLSNDERRKIEQHIAECDECLESVASAYRLLNDIENTDAPVADPEIIQDAKELHSNKSSATIFRFSPVRYRMAGILAILVAVVGVLFFVYSSNEPETEQFRSANGAFSLELLLPSDGASIQQTDIMLRWEGINNALFYTVNLFEEDGTPLVTFETDSTSLTISGEDHLTTGKTYFWNMEGFLQDGRIVESGMNVFTYTPN